MSRADRDVLGAVLLVASLGLGCGNTIGDSSTSTPAFHRLLLFCDLSESTDFAAADLDTIVQKILLGAPIESEVKILALHARTENAAPIFVQKFGRRDSDRMEKEARTDAAIQFSGKLKAYRGAIGDSKKQSCILDSLPRVRQFVLEPGYGGQRLLVGYLSDMIEDCPPPVRLPKGAKDLAHAMLLERLGNHYEEHIKLGDLRLVVCQPGSASGASPQHSEFGRMKLLERRDLWQRIFAKAGIKREIIYPDGAEGCLGELLRIEVTTRE